MIDDANGNLQVFLGEHVQGKLGFGVEGRILLVLRETLAFARSQRTSGVALRRKPLGTATFYGVPRAGRGLCVTDALPRFYFSTRTALIRPTRALEMRTADTFLLYLLDFADRSMCPLGES